jgi:hypothetical protein
MLSLMGGVVAI